MGGLPSDETRREPPEGDRVEVASIRRDPTAQKKFSRGCPDGAETDHAHRRVFALNRLSHLLQRSPPRVFPPPHGSPRRPQTLPSSHLKRIEHISNSDVDGIRSVPGIDSTRRLTGRVGRETQVRWGGRAVWSMGFPSSIAPSSFRRAQTINKASTADATPNRIAARWRGTGVPETSWDPSVGGRAGSPPADGMYTWTSTVCRFPAISVARA